MLLIFPLAKVDIYFEKKREKTDYFQLLDKTHTH